MADTGNRAPLAPQHAQTDAQSDELKMRRSLGLMGKGQPQTPQQRPDQARARHRFVQDGGVPVVVLNHRTDETQALKERITEVERQLETERAMHASTRRTLNESQAAVQALETRLVHAGLAHKDALEQERRALTAAQQALSEALAGSPRRRVAPAVAPEVAESAVETAIVPARFMDEPAGEAAPKAKRGRPRTRPIPEPKPVRWWTPSFRAKTKA